MKAVIYTRYSPRPTDSDSIEAQIRDCRAYCEYKHYDILKEFKEPSASAATIANRPIFQEALELTVKQKACLVVSSLTRLARNTKDALSVLEAINESKAEIAILDYSIDTTNPIGKMLFTIVSAFAAFEREMTVERTKKAMNTYIKNGRVMSSRTPYGYKLDPDSPPHPTSGKPTRMIPCDKEQLNIGLIRELREKYKMTGEEIIAELEDRNIDFRGGQWHKTTLFNIMKKNEIK